MNTIIVGCTKVGIILASELCRTGHYVAVVDRNAKRFCELPSFFHGVTVEGVALDFSVLEKQEGDETTTPFSFDTDTPPVNKAACYIAYTNDETKKVILDNIQYSPLYSGKIHGVGPRYCPSFEDKIMHFPDKKRHQLFVEPCGLDTEELYLQGMSSSLPEAVQLKFLRTIKGLEHV